MSLNTGAVVHRTAIQSVKERVCEIESERIPLGIQKLYMRLRSRDGKTVNTPKDGLNNQSYDVQRRRQSSIAKLKGNAKERPT